MSSSRSTAPNERRYIPLKPASPAAESYSRSHEPSEFKRRRIGASVACNDCRRKKIRCDGQCPVCSNCQGLRHRCEYRNEGGLSQESRDVVVEFVRLLNQVPATAVLRILNEVKHETSAPRILSTLRGYLKSQPQHANPSAEVPIPSGMIGCLEAGSPESRGISRTASVRPGVAPKRPLSWTDQISRGCRSVSI